MAKTKIKTVHGRRTWDLAGHPAIEIDVTLRYGAFGRVIAPLANSSHQNQQDIETCIAFTNNDLNKMMKGRSATDQIGLDQYLVELSQISDLVPAASELFSALSQACLLAAADTEKLPLWQYLGSYLGHSNSNILPLPIIEIFASKYRTRNASLVSRFSVVPVGAERFSQALSWCRDVFESAKNVDLKAGVTDEEILNDLSGAIESAGLRPAQDVAIAIDIAQATFDKPGHYVFDSVAETFSSDALTGLFVDWASKFPIVSIQTPFAADDLESYKRLTWAIGKKVQVIMPPLKNHHLLEPREIDQEKIGNSVLLSHNNALTISNIQAHKKVADDGKLSSILPIGPAGLSDTLPIHLAVGLGIHQIKLGPPDDAQSMMIWQDAIRIAEAIAEVAGKEVETGQDLPLKIIFPWG